MRQVNFHISPFNSIQLNYMVWSNSIFQKVYEIKAITTLCPVKQTLLRIKNLIKAIYIVVNFKHH